MKNQTKIVLVRSAAILALLAFFSLIALMLYQDSTIEYDMVCTDTSGVTFESGWSDQYWYKNSTGATVWNHDTIHAMEPTETCALMKRRL